MLGLGFKLVLGPLLLTLLFVGVLSHTGQMTQVTLAMQYGLNAPLITPMVGIGIVLSFLTLPIWYLALSAI